MAQQGAVGGSIMCGGTVSLIRIPRATPILEVIVRDRISIIGLVPAQLEDILDDPDLQKYDLRSLRKDIFLSRVGKRILFSGGERGSFRVK
jgi:non-ribosomal peptide synthetase component E (peptide arylation enzyme)